jgi:putative transposase
MLLGIRLKANPTAIQKLILSQWMGCARYIWNAKCDEESYYATFARKYCPIGTYAPIDQTTAQFKDKELSPWLYHCPSQIIRNSAANWYQTFVKFMKGQCGKPKRKPKTDKGSIHLTRELFSFEVCEDGVTRLYIGSKRNNIGYLSCKIHREFQLPNSIYIRKECGQYSVSFCYEASNDEVIITDKAHLDYLKEAANMTKQPKAKQDAAGRYVPNQASAKAGLNKAILDKGWHQLEVFTKYKAANAGKAVFKIPAPYTSQECASCGHTHSDNRKAQALFICGHCGNVDNADRNASLVIKKRAIRLIQDSGAELSGSGVLTLSDTGRGASCKPGKPNRKPASSVETSKKNRTATTHVAA